MVKKINLHLDNFFVKHYVGYMTISPLTEFRIH